MKNVDIKNGADSYPVKQAISFINYRTNTPMKLWVGTADQYGDDPNAPEEGVVYIITQN